MIEYSTVQTVGVGAAFQRKASAVPQAYRARERAIAARIEGESAAVASINQSKAAAGVRSRNEPRRQMDEAERASMLKLIPALRAFAASLSGSTDAADDLVQETLARAIAHIDSFEPGTNMGAWLFTILRNLVFSESRKKRRDAAYRAGAHQAWKTHPEQTGKLEMVRMRQALMLLPSEQCEAILLVGASGFSYEEAAEAIGCAVGTVKSRVSRARERLVKAMQVDASDRFGPEGQELAVVA